ncbi:TIGR01841 family phasin [Pseudoduganella sp. GCM10020061]|uniref:TIGR01841 family phasin n=1 Tax=Pseudoduganella sp. GCM10020061 TaxID=3317345 RepID=UPI0036293950
MNALAPTPALQSHLDAQVSLMTDMAGKMYDAIHRITELNLKLAQQLVDDSMAATRQVISSAGPIECCAALVASSVPASEHLRTYQQQLMNVVAGTQVELTRAAETHIPEANRAASAVADDMVRRSTQATERLASEQRSALERMAFPAAAVPNGGAENQAQ